MILFFILFCFWGSNLKLESHASFHRKPRHPDATAATVAFSRCLLIIRGSIASIDSPNCTHFELGESNYEGEGNTKVNGMWVLFGSFFHAFYFYRLYLHDKFCVALANLQRITSFMVFSVTCTLCKGPELDAWRFQSVASANCHI